MILLKCLSASISLGQFAKKKKSSLPRLETSSIACCSTVSANKELMRPAIAQGHPGDSGQYRVKTGCPHNNKIQTRYHRKEEEDCTESLSEPRRKKKDCTESLSEPRREKREDEKRWTALGHPGVHQQLSKTRLQKGWFEVNKRAPPKAAKTRFLTGNYTEAGALPTAVLP